MPEFRFMTKEKGFTLAEILVVVAIISILVAIAVPVYNKTTAKADHAAHDANVRTLISAAQVYMYKAWNETAKDAETMELILANYLSEGAYPENPTDSGSYEVTIDAQGKIEVSPGIGQY